MKLPIVIRTNEAESKRAEIADALLALSADIRSGEFQFVKDEVFWIRYGTVK